MSLPQIRYTVSSPRLLTPLVFDRVETSESVVRMLTLRFLMTQFPGEFDMEDIDDFEITKEEI